MSTTITPLQEGHYYHIYNRGISSGQVFFEQRNYNHFLQLMVKYVTPLADVLCYCLMNNHFHLLVKIHQRIEKPAHLGFSHLFNSYTQSLNQACSRTGKLFEKPFRRKLIDSERYLTDLIIYIHRNPAYHRVQEDFWNYPHSSYRTLIGHKPTHLQQQLILDYFGGRENFIEAHREPDENLNIARYIIEA